MMLRIHAYLSIFLASLISGCEPAARYIETVDLFHPEIEQQDCSWDTAEPRALKEIALRGERHIMECVRVSGYLSDSLYDGLNGWIRSAGDRWKGAGAFALRRNKVGIYFSDDWEKFEDFQRRNVEILATVYSCKRWLSDRATGLGEKFHLLYGYCEYAIGPILIVHSARLDQSENLDLALETKPKIVDEGGGFIISRAQAEPECTLENSTQLDFLTATRQTPRYLRQCVQIRGFYAGSRYFHNRFEGMYLAARDDEGFETRSLYQIGLYPDDARWHEFEGNDDRKVTIMGRLDTCARLYVAARLEADRKQDLMARGHVGPEGETLIIVMMGGYCHYDEGTVLFIDGIEWGPRISERLKGERARMTHGDLVLVPATWEHYAAVEKAIQKWEKEASTANHGKVAVVEWLERKASQGSNPQIFAKYSRRVRNRLVSGAACYCREKECTDDWPISTLDIWYRPEHPFICLHMDYEDSDGTITADDTWYFYFN